MGFLTRLLVPRGVRRAMHPVRTVKNAVTPRPVKRLRSVLNPVSSLSYGLEREVTSALKGSAGYWRHGSCQVKHRTPGAAQRCRKR